MYSGDNYFSGHVFQVAVSCNTCACFPYFLTFSLIHLFIVFNTLVAIHCFLLIIIFQFLMAYIS